MAASPQKKAAAAGGEADLYDDNPAPRSFDEKVFETHGVPLYPDMPAESGFGKFTVDGWQDLWAAVLFFCLLFVVIVWGSINFNSSMRDAGADSAANENVEGAGVVVGAIFGSAAFGVLLAAAGVMALCTFPREMIYVANVIAVLLMLAGAITFFVAGSVFGGVIFLLCAVWRAVWLYFARARIAFSALLLQTACTIVSRYKATVAVSLLAALVTIIYSIFAQSMIYPASARALANKPSNTDGAVMFFGIFMMYFAIEVFANVAHVTTSGVAATFYFAGGMAMPRNPTLASMKRALTTSFGSICLGSLLVAIIRTIEYFVRQAMHNKNEFVRCIAICLISCIRRIAEFINEYALVHCAIYGVSFVEGAKRTYGLIKQCGWATVFTSSLVGETIIILALSLAALGAAVAGAASQNWGVAFIVFLITFAMQIICYRPITSSVTTIFVCFAQCPRALQTSSPALFDALVASDAATGFTSVHNQV